MEELRSALTAYYLPLKTLHLLAAGMWAFSTAVAFRNYLVPAFRAWFREPDNPVCVARRDDAMERFDRGAELEHWAFPLLLITGIALVWLGGWGLQDVSWLTAKLTLVLIIFVPMEAVDYYLSHFGGNKQKIRASGDMDRYEQTIGLHWKFFKVTTPLVITLIPLTYYLAVTKPF
jgi:uncharacterized membrane protein